MVEVNHQGLMSKQERVIETLQLFPLNSFEESEKEKMRLHANDRHHHHHHATPTTFSSYSCGTEIDHHPPLDLRLSFL